MAPDLDPPYETISVFGRFFKKFRKKVEVKIEGEIEGTEEQNPSYFRGSDP